MSALPFPPEWADGGACRGVDPTIFFPGHGGTYVAAKKLCDRCKVREECLAECLEYEGFGRRQYRHGMFGGFTPEERETIAEQPRRCQCCGRSYLSVKHSTVCGNESCKAWVRTRRNARYNKAKRAA